MNLRIVFISLFVLIVSLTGTASAASQGVSKNMEILAKVLCAKQAPFVAFENNKYIVDKVAVIEVGKNLGRGMPVKFRMTGVRGYKKVPPDPPASVLRGRVFVHDPIEYEEKLDKTIVVFYSKDEFDKWRACTNSPMYECVSEENMDQHRAYLEEMVTKHKLDMVEAEKERRRLADISNPNREKEANEENNHTLSTTTPSPKDDNVKKSGTGSDAVADNVKKFNKWLLKGQGTSQ